MKLSAPEIMNAICQLCMTGAQTTSGGAIIAPIEEPTLKYPAVNVLLPGTTQNWLSNPQGSLRLQRHLPRHAPAPVHPNCQPVRSRHRRRPQNGEHRVTNFCAEHIQHVAGNGLHYGVSSETRCDDIEYCWWRCVALPSRVGAAAATVLRVQNA